MRDTSNDTLLEGGDDIVEPKKFQKISRRELLKLSPILALGGTLIPKLRDPILSAGVKFSNWASHASFRTEQLTETFSDRQVVPLEKFPFNYYDTLDQK